MNTASWIVATHFRPKLLWVALASIRDQVNPPGWTSEVIVAHHEADHDAKAICAEMRATAVSSSAATGGGKRNAALRVATGDLVLVADDDDHQSPDRTRLAISAYVDGHGLSELREFRYLHVDSGQVVRWCGRGDHQRPPVTVGTARNYRRTLLARVGGWKPLPRLIEKDIQARIAARLPGKGGKALDLGTELSSGTICLQHGTNIWDDRPAVPAGKIVDRGAFRLLGEGHWRDLADFPVKVAERLRLA